MNGIEITMARKSLSLTQSQAAALIKVSLRTWQQWENEQRSMRKSYWDLFCMKTNFNQMRKKGTRYSEYSMRDIRYNGDELAVITHQRELISNKENSIKFIDLFAGIGGIRRSFETHGNECVFSSEIDPFAKYTYYANYGVVPYGDICKVELEGIPDHDVLCGGFPCQPFSHIGKREGFKHPTQGTMFDEILRVIDTKTPKVVFLENVPGLVNHDNGRTLKTILNELKRRGYDCHHTILNSNDFGVPQHRKRFYLVCFKERTNFSFPMPPNEYVNIGDFLEENKSGYSISKHLQGSYLFKKDDGRPKIVDRESIGSIKTLVSTYHKIQRLTGTFVRDGETGLRLLSENECKSIMGFPQDFYIPVSRTQMYRQMGNSVVIPVVQAIAKQIVQAVQEYKR